VPAAVHQDQRTLRAEAAKIEKVETGGADEPGGVRLAEGGAQGRQVVELVTKRDVAGIRKLLDAERSDRNR
jgi:hypothetical protein